MVATSGLKSPYVGPRPFERGDSRHFFGRDQESAELLALIIAHRVVVLYAPSGAGKTSLLNAQIVPQLEARGFEVFPPTRVQGAVQVPLAEDINPYTFFALMGWAGEEQPPETLSSLTIADYLALQEPLEDKYGHAVPRVLIFDQFEELFTAFPTRWTERAVFFNQMNDALAADPGLRIIFSLREDYIALLEPFAATMPNHLRHRFRLERMRPPAALAAITGPLGDTSRSFSPGVAESLVQELQQTRVESPGGIITATGEFIEPVQLQVVCQNLWQALPADVNDITQADIETYGDVNQALAQFYENVLQQTKRVAHVRETQLRDWFETKLITPAETRGIVFQDQEKGETGGLNNNAVRELDRLHIIRGEVRSGSRWYELTHDRFIDPILKANEAWRRQQRAFWLKAGIGFVLFCAVVILVTFSAEALSASTAEDGAFDALTRQAATLVAANTMQIANDATGTADAGTRQALEVEATRAMETAVAATVTQDRSNQTATATASIAYAQATLAANSSATSAALATLDSQATASAVAVTEIARATIDAQATMTAEELARRSQPIRPLRPGISIGAEGSGSAGTLSGFAIDNQGAIYLLALDAFLGNNSAILQPGPIDGGKPDNLVATSLSTVGDPNTDGVVAAADLVGMARLQPDVDLGITIPEVGTIMGVRAPVAGTAVTVVGRTTVDMGGRISPDPPAAVYDVRLPRSAGLTSVLGGVPLVDVELSVGDEGALVLDQEHYAVGIVIAVEPVALMVPMPDVLAGLNAELLYVGQEIGTFSGPQRELESIRFSADGRWLAGTSKDTDTFLWDVTTGPPFSPAVVLEGHTSGVWDLAFSPDGLYLVTGGILGQVYLWDLTSGNVADSGLQLQEAVGDIVDIDISPDSRWIAGTGASTNVYLWDLQQRDASGRPALTVLAGENGIVNTLLFSPDSRWLSAASQSGMVVVWDLSDWTRDPAILSEHTGTVITLAYSPDSQLLSSGGADTIVRIWNLAVSPPQRIHAFTGHTNAVTTMAFAPDGNWLATGSRDNDVWLWHLEDQVEYRLAGHIGWVRRVVFSPDGQWLVSGSNDSDARLWDLTNGQPGEQFILLAGHTSFVRHLAFSPDGRWLATGSDDRTIKLWQIK